MLKPEEVREDLNKICHSNDAVWLDYDSIHTENEQKDLKKYLKTYEYLGINREQLLLLGGLSLKYGGGEQIAYGSMARLSGSTIRSLVNNKNLVCISGFDTLVEQYVVYHECGHLYQNSLGLFPVKNQDNYIRYLRENHANTFAAAVFFIKTPKILDYKKARLWLLSKNTSDFFTNQEIINGVFGNTWSKYYYASLPVEAALLKDIHRQGRKNFIKKYTNSDGGIKFEELAYYCKDIVEANAYTPEYLESIMKNPQIFKKQRIYRQKKIYRILGKAFRAHITLIGKQKIKKRRAIDCKRRQYEQEKIKPLPDNNEEAYLFNQAAAIDIARTLISQQYSELLDLKEVVKDEDYLKNFEDIKEVNPEKYEQIVKRCNQIRIIYQRNKENMSFELFFNLIADNDGRNKFWHLVEKVRKKNREENEADKSMDVKADKKLLTLRLKDYISKEK